MKEFKSIQDARNYASKYGINRDAVAFYVLKAEDVAEFGNVISEKSKKTKRTYKYVSWCGKRVFTLADSICAGMTLAFCEDQEGNPTFMSIG